MLRTLLYDSRDASLVAGDASLIERWMSEPDTRLWVDIHDEPDALVAGLLKNFQLHPLAIQDAMHRRHPPKIEEFDEAKFILLRGLTAETTSIDFDVIQLAMFVSTRLFVTYHRLPSISADWLWNEVTAKPGMMQEGADALAIKLMNRVIRRFISVLLNLEPRLDELETEIFERPRDELLSELTRYKSRLKVLRRIAQYHRQIAIDLKTDPGKFISPDLAHDVIDVYEQLDRSLSLAQLYYEMADDLINGYLAFSSHRLNQIMRVLTIFTVIFVPLTFLAGIYGMNFENMPELRSDIGYFVVLGLMVVIVAAQLAVLKLKKWL